jgi:hypothetical protein
MTAGHLSPGIEDLGSGAVFPEQLDDSDWDMTAGHLSSGIEDLGSDAMLLEQSDGILEDDSDWDSSTDDISEQDLPLSPIASILPPQESPTEQLPSSPQKTGKLATTSNPGDWQAVGKMLIASSTIGCDWALVVPEAGGLVRPNMLRDRNDFGRFRSGDLKMPSIAESMISTTMDVVMDSGLRGIQPGSLSPLPCLMALGPAQKFVRAYPFKLGDGTGALPLVFSTSPSLAC